MMIELGYVRVSGKSSTACKKFHEIRFCHKKLIVSLKTYQLVYVIGHTYNSTTLKTVTAQWVHLKVIVLLCFDSNTNLLLMNES